MKRPDRFTLRAPTVDDVQAITDLICQSDIEDYGKKIIQPKTCTRTGGDRAFSWNGMRG